MSEQTSQMTESRDGRKLRFEHRSTANGKQTSLLQGRCDRSTTTARGQSLFSEPEGQIGRAAQGHAVPQRH